MHDQAELSDNPATTRSWKRVFMMLRIRNLIPRYFDSALAITCGLVILTEVSFGQNAGQPSPAGHRRAAPNILVIMPDDVGYWNVGAYSHGMMVPTPILIVLRKRECFSRITTHSPLALQVVPPSLQGNYRFGQA